jgi:hypothetical protein
VAHSLTATNSRDRSIARAPMSISPHTFGRKMGSAKPPTKFLSGIDVSLSSVSRLAFARLSRL